MIHETLAPGVEIYCGDCLEVMPTFEDGQFDAVITDPPYGIDYQSNMRNNRFDKLIADADVQVQWILDTKRTMKSDSCILVFTRWDVEWEWKIAIENAGARIRSQVIWYKPSGGIGDLKHAYLSNHENMWFATIGDWEFPNRRPISVYHIHKEPNCNYVHPTQKPVSLMVRIINDLTSKGDTILDPFMGSGTTGVACVQTGRKFMGIEIAPDYYEIAKKRIKEALMQPRLL
jgi:site-specific DNA-methyltransferase (adenine-specific)